MELLLVRHALPVRIEGADGPADPPLSATGHQQAEALAAWLAEEPLEAVYTSPLRRAVETAAPLAAATGLEPIVDDDLAEYDRHATSYVPLEEARAEGGELWESIVAELGQLGEQEDGRRWFAAVVAAIERVVATHPGGLVAIVAHGGVINAYLAHILGLGTRMFFEPAYTSVSRVVASRSGARQLVSVNETGHLRATRQNGW